MEECNISKKSPTTYRKTILHIYQSTSCSGLRYPTSSTSKKIKKTSYNLQDFIQKQLNFHQPKTFTQRISSQLNPLRGEICTGDASVKTAFIRSANPEILGHNNQWTDVLHVVGQFPGNNLWTSKKTQKQNTTNRDFINVILVWGAVNCCNMWNNIAENIWVQTTWLQSVSVQISFSKLQWFTCLIDFWIVGSPVEVLNTLTSKQLHSHHCPKAGAAFW